MKGKFFTCGYQGQNEECFYGNLLHIEELHVLLHATLLTKYLELVSDSAALVSERLRYHGRWIDRLWKSRS